MGYWADGIGTITVRTSEEKIQEIIDNLFESETYCNYELSCGTSNEDGTINIDVEFNDTHWHEEDIYAIFNAFKEYTVDGDIICKGEDGCHRKYRFNIGKGWKESNGEVVFDSDRKEEQEKLATGILMELHNAGGCEEKTDIYPDRLYDKGWNEAINKAISIVENALGVSMEKALKNHENQIADALTLSTEDPGKELNEEIEKE